ncbi:hypothetical protein RIF29_15894 [Crotalaria pallida]|uniref:Uncharacterized protein n=1 Tax=Crotalaria pallida TaxID=3830 RepID=A0AAN9IF28_CROPI
MVRVSLFLRFEIGIGKRENERWMVMQVERNKSDSWCSVLDQKSSKTKDSERIGMRSTLVDFACKIVEENLGGLTYNYLGQFWPLMRCDSIFGS